MPKKSLSRLIRILTGARDLEVAEWFSLEAGFSRLERFAHFWALAVQSFIRNRCPARASALSYTTLLALIPMLAVAVSVTSIFLKSEGEDQIYRFVDNLVAGVMPPAAVGPNAPAALTNSTPTDVQAGQLVTNLDLTAGSTNEPAMPVVTSTGTNAPVAPAGDMRVVLAQKRAAQHIHTFIQNIRGGTLGATGSVLLIFVAISLLSRIEDTFNDIWGVTRGRNWLVRIVRYWATITLGPLLLAVALALASGPHFQTTKKLLSTMPFVGNFIFQFLPVLVLWIAFALFYQLMPNTKVQWRAAFIGGIIGGTLWHLNNVFGFLYVSRVVSNSKIYGSLGLVPVFMIGLYFSWLILLFGAQVAYAYQNRRAYLQDKLVENVNQRGREFIALRLMTFLGQRFQSGLRPATISEAAAELGIPSRLVSQVMQTLLAARLVVEVTGTETAYTPARPLDSINAHHILLAMRAGQGQEPATRDEPVRAEVYGEFARIQEAERQAASAVTVLALANRARARLEIAPPANERVGGRSSSSATKTDGADAVPPED